MPVTPAPGDLQSSSGSTGTCMYAVLPQTSRYIHINTVLLKKGYEIQ